MSREVRLEMPHRGGYVALRIRKAGNVEYGSLWFEDRPIVISTSCKSNRNGNRSVTEAMGLAEWSCGTMLYHLGIGVDPLRLEPRPKRGVHPLDRLNRVLDPKAYQTEHWLLDGGSSANGVIYNTHLIASCKIQLEIELDTMTAWYYEEDNFDDG